MVRFRQFYMTTHLSLSPLPPVPAILLNRFDAFDEPAPAPLVCPCASIRSCRGGGAPATASCSRCRRTRSS